MNELVRGPLPDELLPLAFLLGTWRGEGEGDYPTIDAFRYGEELTFEHVGDPFLLYTQQSWLADEGTPLHFERGFLRSGDEPRLLELTLAHPLGLTEIAHGRLEGTTMEFASEGAVGRTRTGSAVTGLARRYRAQGGTLRYEVDMAMDEVPMTRHLHATLRRSG